MSSKELVIDHATSNDVLFPKEFGRGLVERDLTKYPPGHYMFAPPAEIKLIPRSEWSARIKEMEETKSRLSDIRMTGDNGKMIPALDQGQYGYCWAHSTVGCIHMLRAMDGQPYVPLSAFAVAATIKNGANEGGWGAQSLDFVISKGVPDQKYWPQGSANLSHGTAECWANAALHKVTEDWQDLTNAQYDRNLTFDQVMTLLLSRIPVVGDFNFWGHSVCLLDPVEVEPGSFGVRLLNSWSNSWSDRGMGVLRGNQAIPDGAVAPRATKVSPV